MKILWGSFLPLILAILGILFGYYTGRQIHVTPCIKIHVPVTTSSTAKISNNSSFHSCSPPLHPTIDFGHFSYLKYEVSSLFNFVEERDSKFRGIVFPESPKDSLLVTSSGIAPSTTQSNFKIPSGCKSLYTFNPSKRESVCMFFAPVHASRESMISSSSSSSSSKMRSSSLQLTHSTIPSLHTYRVLGTARVSGHKAKDHRAPTGEEERRTLIPELIRKMPVIRDKLKVYLDEVMGSNDKKEVMVMCLNDGMMDLLLNLACSADRYKLDFSNMLVFASSYKGMESLQQVGIPAFYDEAMGSMPDQAARAYGDPIFMKMMVLKVVSVYLTLQTGYDVIFQDVDLVWFHEPLPYLDTPENAHIDLFMMDDGARVVRYTPFFGNSGFYYMRRTERMVRFMHQFFVSLEIVVVSHSHQESMLQLVGDNHRTLNMGLHILDDNLFPQGKVFHRNKPVMTLIVTGKIDSILFHMCWTKNREDKVKYFKNIGMWYLKDECTAGDHQTRGIRETIMNQVTFEKLEQFDKNTIPKINFDRIRQCCKVGKDEEFYQPKIGYKDADIRS